MRWWLEKCIQTQILLSGTVPERPVLLFYSASLLTLPLHPFIGSSLVPTLPKSASGLARALQKATWAVHCFQHLRSAVSATPLIIRACCSFTVREVFLHGRDPLGKSLRSHVIVLGAWKPERMCVSVQ